MTSLLLDVDGRSNATSKPAEPLSRAAWASSWPQPPGKSASKPTGPLAASPPQPARANTRTPTNLFESHRDLPTKNDRKPGTRNESSRKRGKNSQSPFWREFEENHGKSDQFTGFEGFGASKVW